MPVHELGERQQKQLDREIRDMMSILTRRLAHLHKKPTVGGSSSNIHHHDHEEDEHGGSGIITMAGSNEGATMRGEVDPMSIKGHKSGMKEHNDEQSLPPLTTYLNSNFQGVNNSIMVGGSYSANDPGIHLDVDDHYDQNQGEHALRSHGRKGKKMASSSGSSTSDHSL